MEQKIIMCESCAENCDRLLLKLKQRGFDSATRRSKAVRNDQRAGT